MFRTTLTLDRFQVIIFFEARLLSSTTEDAIDLTSCSEYQMPACSTKRQLTGTRPIYASSFGGCETETIISGSVHPTT